MGHQTLHNPILGCNSCGARCARVCPHVGHPGSQVAEQTNNNLSILLKTCGFKGSHRYREHYVGLLEVLSELQMTPHHFSWRGLQNSQVLISSHLESYLTKNLVFTFVRSQICILIMSHLESYFTKIIFSSPGGDCRIHRF